MDIISSALLKVGQQSQRNPLMFAVSGMAAATALGICLYSFSGTNNQSSDSDSGPALTEQDTTKVMAAFLEKLKLVAIKHKRAADNIRQQVEAQGQQIDERQLMAGYMLPHFETALKDLTTQILEEYNIEEDELQESVAYYIKEGNLKLKEISKSVNNYYKQFGGEIDEEEISYPTNQKSSSSTSSNQDLSLDEFSRVLDKLTELLSTATDGYLQAFKEKYGVPTTTEVAEQLQQGMMVISEESEMKAYESFGLNADQFNNAIAKYQATEEVQGAIARIQ
eukprot:gene12697-26751_t